MSTITKGQEVAADVAALLRARNPLLWVVTREETRVEKLLSIAALAAGYIPHTWDCAQGACDLDGRQTMQADNKPIDDMLATIKARAEGGSTRDVWIMRDAPIWIDGPIGVLTQRALRNLVKMLPGVVRDKAQAVIVLTTNPKVPDELSGHTTVVEFPLPDRNEIAAILQASIAGLPDGIRDKAANGNTDAAIDAAVGLTEEEAQSCYARSLVQLKKIDPKLVAKEKRRIIAREKVLEWFDPIPGGLDAIGGLENLKGWLIKRKLAFSTKAREYGLPSPKGCLLAGISGCGKSLTAKAIATAWGVPLLRLDMGALKDKYVGSSEANIRKAFSVIKAMGRCVVWIDEIEKALAGATQGAADGGVASDALGAFLSWMQDGQGEAFVIATANDITGLPPELLRKGRFDEIWWIDLPNAEERVAVLAAALKAHGRAPTLVNLEHAAACCVDFTGSEIAAIVPDALFQAFADGGREITTHDLIDAAKTVVPLSKTAEEKITNMRKWAKGKARPATAPILTEAEVRTGRRIDI